MLYRIPVEVAATAVAAPNSPAAVDLNFDQLLPGISLRPETISLLCAGESVPHRLSDDFRYGNAGTLYFLIRHPSSLNYLLTIESEETHDPPVPDYLPVIGIGDPLHHNTGRPMPLPLTFGPQINDLTGDGTLHLTMGTHWTTYFGWPSNVLLHRTGVSSETHLEFGPVAAIRCLERGESAPRIISEDFYIRHHIVDWDADGREDLVTVNSRPPQRVEFYRNTGESGPLFAHVATCEVANARSYLGLQLVDFFGDGRLHLVIGGNEHRPGHEKEPYTSYIQWYRNLADPGEIPRFAAPQRLKLADGREIRFQGAGWEFVFTDLNGDGHPDLLYGRRTHRDPLVWYRNLGPFEAGSGSPVFGPPSVPGGIELADGAIVKLGWASCGPFEGPIVNGQVYHVRIDVRSGTPEFHSPIKIMGTNPEVNGGSQPWLHPCDWDGDGDLDLLTGEGRSHIQLIENIGSRERPAFKPLVSLHNEEGKIRIWRDGVFGGNHWHGVAGYTTPVCADWDGDGLPDVIVANETNRIFWFRNQGTREVPEFGCRQQIEVEAFEDSLEKRRRTYQLTLGENAYPVQADEAFGWRQKPSVVDWNGNRLLDLVAVDGEGFYCLYERFRDENDSILKLRKARRFRYEDGEPVTHDSIPREVSGTDGMVVCDWWSRGVWDILVATCYAVFLLKNVTDNTNPIFARPVALRLWGEVIRHSRHGLTGHAVDWDGDGRLSWLAGSESGMYFLFRRSALDADAPPEVKIGRAERVE